MKVRPFDWRDLLVLHGFRTRCLFLDSALVLTSGPVFAPARALLSSVSSATGIFTFLAQDKAVDPVPLIGQVIHNSGKSSARLSFIAPREPVPVLYLAGIIEAMEEQIGERGGMQIVAEVESEDPLYERLRQVGFGVYARQRVWRLGSSLAGQVLPGLRRVDAIQDTAAIRFLYANLVPGLVQQVEPPFSNRLQGLVFYRGNELLVYVDIRYGARGVWVQPFVHPDGEAIAEPLIRTLRNPPNRNARPVYLCVRTYQSWLEPVIERLGAEPGPPQAVLVRHLALARRQMVTNSVVVMNNKTAEPTLPVIR